MSLPQRPVGQLLREWRERRRLSQLELSLQAEVSTRHLSFLETGRSRPTPEMILKLTEHLDVPLRERNQLRLSLHPDGLAPRILNLAQWRAHLLGQVRRRLEQTGDEALQELYDELEGYPGGVDPAVPATNVVLPMRLAHPDGELSLLSISAVVETAADLTVQELSIESFYPADAESAARMRALAAPSA